MPVSQHPCKCGSDQVSMVPAGGGRGTKDSLFFTGHCSACGFTLKHLPENSDGRRATAIRDWNREVKSRAAPARPRQQTVVTPTAAQVQVKNTSQPAQQVVVPAEYKSDSPRRLRKLVTSTAGRLSAEERKLLLDVAAEIEGGEEAYSVLVGDIQELRKTLAHTEQNLRATIAMIPTSKLV